MIQLSITVNPVGASPRELRARFVLALRQAIARAMINRRLELQHAEELWRVIPNPDRV